MGSWIKNNFFIFFFGIFALIGTGCGIGAAVTWLNSVDLSNTGVQTTGIVTDLIRSSKGSTQAPVVEFQLENGTKHTYTSNVFSSPPAYDLGERIALWYDPADPDVVVMDGLDRWFAPLFLGVFFLIFGGIGYGGLIYQVLKKRDINWLKQNGTAVEAMLTGVDRDYSFKVNGVSPFVIQGQWLDRTTNKMYTFKSENIWYDPSEYVRGQTLRVLIDPAKPGLYYMDVSFLPEKGN